MRANSIPICMQQWLMVLGHFSFSRVFEIDAVKVLLKAPSMSRNIAIANSVSVKL